MTRKTLCSLATLLFLLPTACGGSDFETPKGETGGTAGENNGGTGAAATGGAAGSNAGSGGTGASAAGGTAGMTTGGTGGMQVGGAGGGGPLVDCTGQDDGTPCEGDGDNTLCVKDQCVQSECGDGYADENNDETCDDGKNGDNDDGCTDECKATCTVDADCDDGNPCNGKETCSADNKCELGQAVNCDDGNACTADSCVMANGSCAHEALDDGATCGSGKICLSVSCKTSVCGDHYVDTAKGEECDDGKDGDNTDGCKDDCKFTCKTNADCNDDNACTNDVCNTSTHTCTNTDISSTCNDGDACTTDSCNPLSGCVNAFIDADGDGYSPENCKAGGAHSGKGNDCNDADGRAFPGQTAWFSSQAVGGGWDYNCSTVVEKKLPNSKGSGCTGWVGSVPACGANATYDSSGASPFGGCVCSQGNCVQTVTQTCH
ncbi:MAG: hypothetical protein R3B07_23410 [Polyangiaceae bacterium]